MWVYVNGNYVPEKEATISVFDHGFLYGDGVYETLRIYQGRPFLLDRHLVRLRHSCELIGLGSPLRDEEWRPILAGMLHRNQLFDAGFRLTISRGAGEMGIDPGLCPFPTVVVMAKVLSSYSRELREQGVRLELVSVRRNPLAAQSPQIKSLSFLNNILAKQEAAQAGAFDALMLNMDQHVTECTTSNIFFVKQGTLCTPSAECGILKGITREVIMELARDLGLSVEEGHYGVDALLQADECFITNTGMEVMPVSQIGQNVIGAGKAGPMAMSLWRAFQDNLSRFLGPPLLERPA
ncbi:MAG: aminotransferase class IV [Nitrospirales bacterium]